MFIPAALRDRRKLIFFILRSWPVPLNPKLIAFDFHALAPEGLCLRQNVATPRRGFFVAAVVILRFIRARPIADISSTNNRIYRKESLLALSAMCCAFAALVFIAPQVGGVRNATPTASWGLPACYFWRLGYQFGLFI